MYVICVRLSGVPFDMKTGQESSGSSKNHF